MIHIPVGSNLDHRRQRVESIRHWSLEKGRIQIERIVHHQIGIIRKYWCSLSGTSCMHCQHLLCSLFSNIPILIHHWQLLANCITTSKFIFQTRREHFLVLQTKLRSNQSGFITLEPGFVHRILFGILGITSAINTVMSTEDIIR